MKRKRSRRHIHSPHPGAHPPGRLSDDQIPCSKLQNFLQNNAIALVTLFFTVLGTLFAGSEVPEVREFFISKWDRLDFPYYLKNLWSWYLKLSILFIAAYYIALKIIKVKIHRIIRREQSSLENNNENTPLKNEGFFNNAIKSIITPTTQINSIKLCVVLLLLLIAVTLLQITWLYDFCEYTDNKPGGLLDFACKKSEKVRHIDIRGVDEENKIAVYRIISVSRNYYWKYGSSKFVIDSEGVEIPIEIKLKENLKGKTLKGLTDIIAVGTASCVGNKEEENTRAQERAENIISWLEGIELPQQLDHIYLLNLGQYDVPCRGKEEKRQRKVIIIGVVEKEPGVNVRQSFRNALFEYRKDIFYYLDIQKYTNWSNDKFYLQIHR